MTAVWGVGITINITITTAEPAFPASRWVPHLLFCLSCAHCGTGFMLTPAKHRLRVKKSPRLFCTNACARLAEGKRVARTQISCSYCGKTIELLPSKVRVLRTTSESGHLFCDRSCSSLYWWRERYDAHRIGRLAAQILRRRPNSSDEQAYWEQLLHNLGLGLHTAAIPNSVEPLVAFEVVKHEGKWWEVAQDDGYFTAGNDLTLNDGRF